MYCFGTAEIMQNHNQQQKNQYNLQVLQDCNQVTKKKNIVPESKRP